MTWISKYIKAEWEQTDDIVYCKECMTQVDMEVDTDDGEKRCSICGSDDILPIDRNMTGRCTECMSEVDEPPDGNCSYCGGKGTVLYGEDAEFDPKTIDEVFDAIKDVYGQAPNMNCATWLLPDGFMTNGCYGYASERGIDHRDISPYMGKFKDGLEDSTDIMNRFMELGAIRLKPSNVGPAAQIAGRPTADQIDALENFFAAFRRGPYMIQFGFDVNDYIEVDEYWDVGHELKKRFWAGYSMAESLTVSMKKYASALPRGYFDGLVEALRVMDGQFVEASRRSIAGGGNALDAAEAVESVVYDQLGKKMGFEDVEVVEAFGSGDNASITVFNPQTDEASEITIDLPTGTICFTDVDHEIDVSDVFAKAASIDKKAAISVKKIVRQRKYKHGYIIRDEYWAIDPDDPEEEWTLMERMAYTPCGEYIGDSKEAYYICKVRGIIPRLASPDHTVCSIGYNPVEKKWYGWSHRAMCGFGIGDMIFEEGFGDDSTNYRKHGKTRIETMEDAMKAAIAFAASVS